MNKFNYCNIKCKKCNTDIFTLQNNLLICNICHQIITNKNDINEKNKNKYIHLKNVLKNIETVDVSLVDKWFDILLQTINEEKIDKKFVDMTYICEFLKNYGIKKYILDMWLYNKYKNIKFKLSKMDKEYIKIIFIEFINFLYDIKSNKLINISYQQILYIIYKYLDSSVTFKPSLTRNNNEDLIKLFDDYLNNLCEQYYKNSKEEINNIYFLPYKDKIENYPNIFYKKIYFN